MGLGLQNKTYHKGTTGAITLLLIVVIMILVIFLVFQG